MQTQFQLIQIPKICLKDWIYNTSKNAVGGQNPIKEYKNLDFEKNTPEASADKSSLEQEKLIFNGNVVINHGNINATSDIASYDSKEILNLKKNIIIRTYGWCRC